MLKNAVFYLLQTIVVIVKFFLDFLEVKVIGGVSVPRQVEHRVNVGILHRVIG